MLTSFEFDELQKKMQQPETTIMNFPARMASVNPKTNFEVDRMIQLQLFRQIEKEKKYQGSGCKGMMLDLLAAEKSK